jgi:hypothetical protein
MEESHKTKFGVYLDIWESINGKPGYPGDSLVATSMAFLAVKEHYMYSASMAETTTKLINNQNMFNPENYKKKVWPHANKIIQHLKTKNIDFFGRNERGNITFGDDLKTLEMSEHSFYGCSRLAHITEFIEGNRVKLTEVTDEMYLQNYILPIIENHFKRT